MERPSPIPEGCPIPPELLVNLTVAFFEIADEGIAGLAVEEEVEEDFGVERWRRYNLFLPGPY